MIQRDVKRLAKVPKILSVILKVEDDGKGGAELERLVNEVAEVSAWCASAGIPVLNIYEKTGTHALLPCEKDRTADCFPRPSEAISARDPPSHLTEPEILLWRTTSHIDAVRTSRPVNRVCIQPTSLGI